MRNLDRRRNRRPYTANKTRSQGRKCFSIIFRHPVRKDATGRSGLRIRRGLGTANVKDADKLVKQMNEILKDDSFWNLDAKSDAIELYDPIIVSAFYDPMENRQETFIIIYESGLGKGWTKIDAVDAKDALKRFKEKEPDIYKLCRYPYGMIGIGEEINVDMDALDRTEQS